MLTGRPGLVNTVGMTQTESKCPATIRDTMPWKCQGREGHDGMHWDRFSGETNAVWSDGAKAVSFYSP